MAEVLDWIVPPLLLLSAAVITVWTAGALYFDVALGGRWGRWLAATWILGVVLLFALWQPLWQPFAVLVGVFAIFYIWWRSQKATNDRDWDIAAAVLPRAVRDGDAITIENLRNFDYCSLTDPILRYESRTYHLANLRGADVIFFDWGAGLLCHPVLVFDFGPDGRLCMSIEARLCKGQKYSVLRSLYRQHEIIFVAADERDIILRRTKYSVGQKAYLYRLNTTLEELRLVFLDYVNAINGLVDTPKWYHVVYANCVTTFYRLPSTQWRWDWRVLVNGRLDDALYDDGRLDRTLPFAELRRCAYLNDIANDAPEAGFGDHIRRELERRFQERQQPSALEGA
jgi:hypothetical protein